MMIPDFFNSFTLLIQHACVLDGGCLQLYWEIMPSFYCRVYHQYADRPYAVACMAAEKTQNYVSMLGSARKAIVPKCSINTSFDLLFPSGCFSFQSKPTEK